MFNRRKIMRGTFKIVRTKPYSVEAAQHQRSFLFSPYYGLRFPIIWLRTQQIRVRMDIQVVCGGLIEIYIISIINPCRDIRNPLGYKVHNASFSQMIRQPRLGLNSEQGYLSKGWAKLVKWSLRRVPRTVLLPFNRHYQDGFLSLHWSINHAGLLKVSKYEIKLFSFKRIYCRFWVPLIF